MNNITTSEKRYVTVYTAVKDSRKFTAAELAHKLNIVPGIGYIDGRRINAVLGDMQLEKLIKKEKDHFVFTPEGRVTLKKYRDIANHWAEPSPVKELFKKIKTEVFAPDDFTAQLIAAVAVTEPRKAPKTDDWWKSSVKKVEAFKTNEDALANVEDFKAPEAPVRGAITPIGTKATFDEAMENFGLNYDEDPKGTVQKLADVVLSQRVRLQAQDRLIREMHVHIRNMNRLLNSYIYDKETATN